MEFAEHGPDDLGIADCVFAIILIFDFLFLFFLLLRAGVELALMEYEFASAQKMSSGQVAGENGGVPEECIKASIYSLLSTSTSFCIVSTSSSTKEA
jgi:hypothetical protein